MERVVRSSGRREYASAVAGLWERLGSALARLERVAEAPAGRIGVEAREELPSLQYSLHAAAELAHGIRPPGDAERAHQELVSALAQARDATAEVVAALDDADDDLAERLLPEWRGALFRVRLARLRALERSPLRLPTAPAEEEAPTATAADPQLVRAAVAATSLVLAGALLFTAGAVLAAWPLWAAGLALFAGGFILFRP